MGVPARPRAPPGPSVHSPGLRSGGLFHTRSAHYSHFRTPLFPYVHRCDRLESISVSPINLGCGSMGTMTSQVIIAARLAANFNEISNYLREMILTKKMLCDISIEAPIMQRSSIP